MPEAWVEGETGCMASPVRFSPAYADIGEGIEGPGGETFGHLAVATVKKF